jgi:2-C-methyl-D-erythritol 2,4-cyclodiphosphate synthase
MLRVGHGWDIHRLVAGGPLRLGGVDIDWEWRLLGHSDGDTVLHAVTDAILGAISAGDIGSHFPDTDPAFQGVDSLYFLESAVRLVEKRGFRVVNADVTVLAERPRLAPHVGAMRDRLAALLHVVGTQVNVKAKTMEQLGPIGEGRAIAATAVVLVADENG